jgi:hypothetical protein
LPINEIWQDQWNKTSNNHHAHMVPKCTTWVKLYAWMDVTNEWNQIHEWKMAIIHMDELHHMANNIMMVDHPYWILMSLMESM